jgi:hypothetical protein
VEIDATDSAPKNIRDDHGVDEARPQSGYGEDGPGQHAEKSVTPDPWQQPVSLGILQVLSAMLEIK